MERTVQMGMLSMAMYNLDQSASMPCRKLTIVKSNRSSQHDVSDPVSMHLLMETAMGDSQSYEVLSPDDLDTLKSELSLLSSRIEATQKKLVLETKVRDATQSISRLPTNSSRDPQRPGSKGTGSTHSSKPSEDVLQSIRKCEELGQELWRLEKQEQQLQKRLLEHTAGVLQLTHKGYLKKEATADDLKDSNGFLGVPGLDDFGDGSHYRPCSQIAEIELGGGGEFAQHNQMIVDVERRVEDLNARLRDVILELRPQKQDLPHPARELRDDPNNPGVILFEQVDFLERCLDAMHDLQKDRGINPDAMNEATATDYREQSDLVLEVERRVEDLNIQLRGMILGMKPQKEDLPNPARELRDDPSDPGGILVGQVDFLERCLEAMDKLQDKKRSIDESSEATEEKLEILNTRLFEIMTQSNPEKASKYTPPPEAMGDTLQDQLDYLEGGLGAVDRRLKYLDEEVEASMSKLTSYQDRAEQYVSVVGGLWDILTDPSNIPGGGDTSPLPNDDFSLQSFSVKVQEVHGKHVALLEQKMVLTRQIQQQRELNATAETAKDTKMDRMREEIETTKNQLEVTSQEAQNHLEKLTLTLAELEAAKGTISMRDQQRSMSDNRALEDERQARKMLDEQLQRANSQLQEMKAGSGLMEVNTLALRSDLEAKTAAFEKADTSLKELEGEVVRLQTELTIAKADLDSAHGSRAQRKAEAAGDPVLQARIQTLQSELSEAISDYETMTKATIEYEREREQLETVADRLRDRVENLESQLAEERIQSMGMKSPGAESTRGAGGGTSAAVLKTEFKKMMRETKMEHSKAIRVSLSNMLQ